MRILLDEQIFSTQQYGGISRYFCEIGKHIITNNKDSVRFSLKFTNNEYLNSLRNESNGKINNINSFGGNGIKKTINRLHSITSLFYSGYDIFIPTYYNPYFLKYKRKNKPYVLTVHDMIDEAYPFQTSYYQKITSFKKKCIENADHIIAISECTKNDLLKYYPDLESKISVIYHGYTVTPPSKESQLLSNHINTNYILYVGKRDHYKNYEFCIRSIAKILRTNNIHIVCAGGGGWTDYEKDMHNELGIENHCIQLNVSDAELASLYKFALMFIFPSEYEGFGLPILEAFSNECPVLLSNSSCFPEIAGSAALYFENGRSEDLENKVKMLLYDTEKIRNFIENGREKLKQYSWKTCCQATLEVYKSIH